MKKKLFHVLHASLLVIFSVYSSNITSSWRIPRPVTNSSNITTIWRIPGPIKVVYVVDHTSKSFLLLSLSSLLYDQVELVNERLMIYVIVTGSNLVKAKETLQLIQNNTLCLNISKLLSFETFVLSNESPLKVKKSLRSPENHWISDTEAIRLLIPEILSNIQRFIYFDNDVILTKKYMLQSLWNNNLGNYTLGIVINKENPIDYAHIVKLYFNYTNSHLYSIFPFNYTQTTTNNMSVENSTLLLPKSFTNISNDISNLFFRKFINQFKQIIPKIPNNGIMLVNAHLWRKNNITNKINKLAYLNNKYKFMAVGSQPYTIAVLYSHWIGLGQIYNLRNSGSINARFYFIRHQGKGILHFAGVSKPYQRCNIGMSYFSIPYVRGLNIYYFAKQTELFENICPSNILSFGKNCSNLLKNIDLFCRENKNREYPDWAHRISPECKNTKKIKFSAQIATIS